jgi:hypothetical protein
MRGGVNMYKCNASEWYCFVIPFLGFLAFAYLWDYIPAAVKVGKAVVISILRTVFTIQGWVKWVPKDF